MNDADKFCKSIKDTDESFAGLEKIIDLRNDMMDKYYDICMPTNVDKDSLSKDSLWKQLFVFRGYDKDACLMNSAAKKCLEEKIATEDLKKIDNKSRVNVKDRNLDNLTADPHNENGATGK
jgi:hypothetical protein